jgi:cation diffusion facilitator CzcD-associated flavoprotein CzcO
LKGLERFAGPQFHSSNWNHSVDLHGKNVAVVGTGASAIQFVPQIAPGAGKLSLFQRTPPWIVPRMDFPIRDKWRQRFRRFPLIMRAFRQFIFWRQEFRVLGFLGNRFVRGKATEIATHHLEKQINDPKLRAALKPNYELGCKRVLVSDDYYPSLTRPNVELVTGAIAEVRERSIVTVDGVERAVDVLIFGTGFRATEPLIGIRLVGRGGVEIHDAWRERMSAYLGVTVSGFPNLFLLLGPNTGLGHNSVVLMIEAQVRYVMSCLALVKRGQRRVLDV